MLFDLRGKRRRVVQISYAALAVIFLVGFVGFSIGSGNSPGGLFDALGLGGSNSSGSVSSQFDDQINAANQQLAKNPNDPAALLKLAENEYFKGKTGVGQDSSGQITISTDAQTDLAKAVDAWEKYLKAVKGQPNSGKATVMVNAYIYLNDAAGAAKTQEIVATARPSPNSYGNLALFRYFAGDIAGGDAAAKKAVAETPKAQQKGTQQQLAGYRKQAVKVKKQQAKASKNAPSPTTPGANPLQSPFGGVGGTTP